MRTWIGLALLAVVAASPGFGQRSSVKLREPPRQRSSWRAPTGVATSVRAWFN